MGVEVLQLVPISTHFNCRVSYSSGIELLSGTLWLDGQSISMHNCAYLLAGPIQNTEAAEATCPLLLWCTLKCYLDFLSFLTIVPFTSTEKPSCLFENEVSGCKALYTLPRGGTWSKSVIHALKDTHTRIAFFLCLDRGVWGCGSSTPDLKWPAGLVWVHVELS